MAETLTVTLEQPLTGGKKTKQPAKAARPLAKSKSTANEEPAAADVDLSDPFGKSPKKK